MGSCYTYFQLEGSCHTYFQLNDLICLSHHTASTHFKSSIPVGIGVDDLEYVPSKAFGASSSHCTFPLTNKENIKTHSLRFTQCISFVEVSVLKNLTLTPAVARPSRSQYSASVLIDQDVQLLTMDDLNAPAAAQYL